MDKTSLAGAILLIVVFAIVGVYYDDEPAPEEGAGWSTEQGSPGEDTDDQRAEDEAQEPEDGTDWAVAPEGDQEEIPEGLTDSDAADISGPHQSDAQPAGEAEESFVPWSDPRGLISAEVRRAGASSGRSATPLISGSS